MPKSLEFFCVAEDVSQAGNTLHLLTDRIHPQWANFTLETNK